MDPKIKRKTYFGAKTLGLFWQILKYKGGGVKRYFGAKTLDPAWQILKYKG
jgi:hypothetical protein